MEFFRTIQPIFLAKVAIMVFFAILFLQSGGDKVIDRKGNLDWMIPHFAKSPFKKFVPFLLTIITIVELAAGAACVWALVSLQVIHQVLPDPSSIMGWPELNLALCIVSFALLQLFLGQRMAKDYAGAASLAGYFAIAMLGFFFAMPG